MNRICLVILILVLLKIDSYAQKSGADTSIVVEDCIKKTIIIEGNLTTTHIEIMDCFWDSEVDTNIVIEDCVKQVIISKQGYKKIYKTNLACYWDNAKKKVDTFLIPKYTDKWSVQYRYLYTRPDGETKSSKSTIGISKYEAYRAGLDTIIRKEYHNNHIVFKNYQIISNNRRTPSSIRDISINKKNVLNCVNEIRSNYCQCGDVKMNPAEPLKWSDKLTYVAYLHAKDMFERDYFSHISPEGDDPGDRIMKSGLDGVYFRGENIAEGQINGIKAVESWKKSPGHCKNMMDSGHTHVGVSKYMDKYVMLLGSEK
jgi:uncharacterized protein YkwD